MLLSLGEMVWCEPAVLRVDAPVHPQPAASVQTALLPNTHI